MFRVSHSQSGSDSQNWLGITDIKNTNIIYLHMFVWAVFIRQICEPRNDDLFPGLETSGWHVKLWWMNLLRNILPTTAKTLSSSIERGLWNTVAFSKALFTSLWIWINSSWYYKEFQSEWNQLSSAFSSLHPNRNGSFRDSKFWKTEIRKFFYILTMILDIVYRNRLKVLIKANISAI